MFKTIIAAITLATAAVSAQANTKIDMFEGSKWHWTHLEVAHVEYVQDTRIRVLDNGNNYSIAVDGSVVKGLAAKLESMLTEIDAANLARGSKYVTTVYLNSNGGVGTEGVAAGKVLRAHSVQTIVTGDMVCWSACSDMFIGGKYRVISDEAVVGLHAPYTKGKYGTTVCYTQQSEGAQFFIDHAEAMLDADTAELYNMWSFKCNVKGGKEVTASQYWLQTN